jgi:DNA-binding transcriptional LysR family regulator
LPSLSLQSRRRFADLEHTPHVRLLDRNPQGVEPTLYGSALVKRGLAVFDELRQRVGEIEFSADPSVGEIRIGCPESVTATLLPVVIKQLFDRYPKLVLRVAQTNPSTLDFRQLRERNIDLMIGRVAPSIAEDDLHVEILFRERVIVVAGAQRRCIDEAVTAVEAARERWCEADIHRIAGEIALASPEPDAAKAESTFRACIHNFARAEGEVLCARRRAWRGYGAISVSGSRPSIFLLRSTAGSPKASTR